MNQSYKGFIDRLTYYNPENGYTIARLVIEGQRERIAIVGTLASIQEGESVEVEGVWDQSSQIRQTVQSRAL